MILSSGEVKISRPDSKQVEKWAVPDFSRTADRQRVPAGAIGASGAHAGPANDEDQFAVLKKMAEREGYEAGRQAARVESAEKLQQLDKIIHGLKVPLDQTNEQVATELVALAFAIARRILQRELQQQPDDLLSYVKSAIAALPAGSGATELTVNPDDLLFLQQCTDELLDFQAITITADQQLAVGNCRVQRNDSQVHGGIDAVVAQLAEHWDSA